MNKITCDTCLDLIPLVKDNVASEDSKRLVEEHIESCEVCKEIYDNIESPETLMNDKDILKKIKKQMLLAALVIIVIASMVGLAISETMGMFYNILIMPAVGIIGYFALNKRSYYVPESLFVFSYVWLFIKYIGEGWIQEGQIGGLFVVPIFWSAIYAGLSALGIAIGFLLKYAFGKEKKYEIK